MNRPVLILIEVCSPHAGNSHSTEMGARGAQQESVGNAAAGMVVGVEREVNLAFTSRTDPKVDKRTRIQGVAKVWERAQSDGCCIGVDREHCAGSGGLGGLYELANYT